MFKFLFFIFFLFILLLLLMGFSIVRTFKRFLFGGGDSRTAERHRHTSGGNRGGGRDNVSYDDEPSRSSRQRKKIFAKDEGEYVDYEEVK